MAERDLDAAIVARLGDRVIYPALFFEGVFWSGGAEAYLRLWSGVGTFAWNGVDWLGGGHLLSVSPVEETSEVRAVGFRVSLNGQASANISLVLQAMRQGKPGKVWLGLLTQAGALVADPTLIKRGKLDVAMIEDSATDCRISVSYEDRLIDLERPREARYTHEDQQRSIPGDRGFEYVPSLQDAKIPWGKGVVWNG